MSCHPPDSEPTPIDRLRQAAEVFALFDPSCSKVAITDAYLDFRNALFDAMTLDIDPHRYDVSWSIIKSFGDKGMGDFQELPVERETYPSALAHLQQLVEESCKYVPWG